MERNYNLSDLEKNFDELLSQEMPVIEFEKKLNETYNALYKNGN